MLLFCTYEFLSQFYHEDLNFGTGNLLLACNIDRKYLIWNFKHTLLKKKSTVQDIWCDLGESVGSRTCDMFSFPFDWSPH